MVSIDLISDLFSDARHAHECVDGSSYMERWNHAVDSARHIVNGIFGEDVEIAFVKK
jgi:hypothetical protein